MDFIRPVEWTDSAKLWYSALAIFFISNAIMEFTGITQIRYSKFRRGKGIPAIPMRLGTLIFDGTAVLVGVVLATQLPANAPIAQWLVTFLLIGAFAKRCLEALFVHKYSGPVDVLSVFQITGFYGLAVWLGITTSGATIGPADAITWLGVALAGVGLVINGYHHVLLAQLRSSPSDAYVIPRGGLFGSIACPHYLGELIAWLGIALVSKQLAMYIWFFGEAAYLLIRANKTLAWYRKTFPDFPRNVRALV